MYVQYIGQKSYKEPFKVFLQARHDTEQAP